MLTDTKARRLKPNAKPIAVGGAVGLYLRSGSNIGTGNFILRFVSPASGKRRDMGLGSYPSIGLAEARRLAGVARVKIAQGIDPISRRDEEKVSTDEEPKFPDFRDAALRVHADLAAGYRNAKHSAQWINTLITYAFPFIGDRQVNGLTTADFADLLRPIWLEKAETAGRVKQRCDRVMTWCIAHRFAMTNPVSAVDALLPKQPGKRERVQHHPAIPWRALPKSLSMLSGSPTAGRDALFFLLFTAARSGEVRGAKWEEFDLDRRVWSVPAVRMKAKMIHRVPLSVQACAVLSRRLQFKTVDPWVFSSQGSKPLSDMTLTKILRTARISSDTEGRIATAHGLRSSFRDWASENGHARNLAERALAHTIHNPTEAAYHRTDQLDQRVKLMQEWANYLAPFSMPT